MLNARGGIECDLTVARLAEDAYYIVTGTGFATHDFAWIARNIPEGADARLADVTSAYATLALMGPDARDILAPLADGDLSHEAFPFAASAASPSPAPRSSRLRITYVGELGWELHIPVEFAATVYDALAATGRVTDAGYRAIESLRLEKGYRAWAAEIGPDHSPLMAGLGFAAEAPRQHALPRPRRARSPARPPAPPHPRRLRRRRPGGHPPRPRDHLPRRPARRLARERRLGLHRGRQPRLRLRPRPRERLRARGRPRRQPTSSRSPPSASRPGSS